MVVDVVLGVGGVVDIRRRCFFGLFGVAWTAGLSRGDDGEAAVVVVDSAADGRCNGWVAGEAGTHTHARTVLEYRRVRSNRGWAAHVLGGGGGGGVREVLGIGKVVVCVR